MPTRMLKPAIKHCGLVILAHTEITDHFGNVSREAHAAFGSGNAAQEATSSASVIMTFFIQAVLGKHEWCFRVPVSRRGSRSWRGRFLVLRPAKPFRIHSEMNFVLEAVVLALGQQFKIIGDRGAQCVHPLSFGLGEVA